MAELNTEDVYEGYVCKSCNNYNAVPGYDVPLCKECREKYIKYPIPISIKIAALIVFVVMIFSLMGFPQSLKAGIYYERGMRAKEQNMHFTAKNEFEKLIEIYPDNTRILANLYMSYIKNEQFREAYDISEKLAGREIASDSLYLELVSHSNIMEAYLNVSEELWTAVNTYYAIDAQEGYDLLSVYMENNPSDPMACIYMGYVLLENKNYEDAEQQFTKAIELNNYLEERAAIGLITVLRETGRLEEAEAQCLQLLDKNVENALALSSYAKVNLNKHEYEEALNLAEKAYNINSEEPSIINALVVTYHYNHMYEKRDELFEKLKQTDYAYIHETEAVLNGESTIYE